MNKEFKSELQLPASGKKYNNFIDNIIKEIIDRSTIRITDKINGRVEKSAILNCEGDERYFNVYLTSKKGKKLTARISWIDLYIIGVEINGTWYYFNDIHKKQFENLPNAKLLSCTGSYISLGNRIKNLSLYPNSLDNAIVSLQRITAPHLKPDHEHAMTVILVGLCEAIRFPKIREAVSRTFRSYENEEYEKTEKKENNTESEKLKGDQLPTDLVTFLRDWKKNSENITKNATLDLNVNDKHSVRQKTVELNEISVLKISKELWEETMNGIKRKLKEKNGLGKRDEPPEGHLTWELRPDYVIENRGKQKWTGNYSNHGNKRGKRNYSSTSCARSVTPSRSQSRRPMSMEVLSDSFSAASSPPYDRNMYQLESCSSPTRPYPFDPCKISFDCFDYMRNNDKKEPVVPVQRSGRVRVSITAPSSKVGNETGTEKLKVKCSASLDELLNSTGTSSVSRVLPDQRSDDSVSPSSAKGPRKVSASPFKGNEDLIIIHDELEYGACPLSLAIPKEGISIFIPTVLSSELEASSSLNKLESEMGENLGQKMDVKLRIRSMHDLSRVLLGFCGNEDFELGDFESRLLNGAIWNLKSFTAGNKYKNVQECHELSVQFETERDPSKLDELGSVLTTLYKNLQLEKVALCTMKYKLQLPKTKSKSAETLNKNSQQVESSGSLGELKPSDQIKPDQSFFKEQRKQQTLDSNSIPDQKNKLPKIKENVKTTDDLKNESFSWTQIKLADYEGQNSNFKASFGPFGPEGQNSNFNSSFGPVGTEGQNSNFPTAPSENENPSFVDKKLKSVIVEPSEEKLKEEKTVLSSELEASSPHKLESVSCEKTEKGEISGSKIDVKFIINSMHDLSQVLLGICGEDFELGDLESELLNGAIQNLKAVTGGNKYKNINTWKIYDNIKACGYSEQTISERKNQINSASQLSNNDYKKSILQGVEKLPKGDSDEQAELYKNLWLEAEVALCTMKYELQLAKTKSKSETLNKNTQKVESSGSLGKLKPSDPIKPDQSFFKEQPKQQTLDSNSNLNQKNELPKIKENIKTTDEAKTESFSWTQIKLAGHEGQNSNFKASFGPFGPEGQNSNFNSSFGPVRTEGQIGNYISSFGPVGRERQRCNFNPSLGPVGTEGKNSNFNPSFRRVGLEGKNGNFSPSFVPVGQEGQSGNFKTSLGAVGTEGQNSNYSPSFGPVGQNGFSPDQKLDGRVLCSSGSSSSSTSTPSRSIFCFKTEIPRSTRRALFGEDSFHSVSPSSAEGARKVSESPFKVQECHELPTHSLLQKHMRFQLIQFSSWMGGDRGGNPRVTPEVARDVCLLARMMPKFLCRAAKQSSPKRKTQLACSRATHAAGLPMLPACPHRLPSFRLLKVRCAKYLYTLLRRPIG